MKNLVEKINIEALLGRSMIENNDPKVAETHSGKNILVTGGAGSIGTELVCQLCQFSLTKLIILDQAETALYELHLDLSEQFPDAQMEFILADVSDRDRLEQIFKSNNIDIIYHAAAYKHVPVLEQNPREGIKVNILGTKNLAELSQKYGVERFVMISTDKAVNPLSIMGATKRIAELLVQDFQHQKGNKTDFIITRFGNVLGSNGSVIFRFQKQIEEGKPLTITHPEATRYFMSIPEACQLVLQAGAVGKGGEIGIFNMGEPIKIVDLAQKMAKLLTYQEAEITFTGLRDGDKITEQLWTDHTEMLSSSHEKIMWCRETGIDFNKIRTLIQNLILETDKEEIILKLKEILPHFRS